MELPKSDKVVPLDEDEEPDDEEDDEDDDEEDPEDPEDTIDPIDPIELIDPIIEDTEETSVLTEEETTVCTWVRPDRINENESKVEVKLELICLTIKEVLDTTSMREAENDLTRVRTVSVKIKLNRKMICCTPEMTECSTTIREKTACWMISETEEDNVETKLLKLNTKFLMAAPTPLKD